ncbi:MAG: hypothetical protein L0Z48_03350 [candidate division Zixibacteria bacterium]|nr:hypothetical protein [candidate division Zixibacteria bacterium]MCI0595561.1 hypothetical protein [candidate division Zixibacteria bacterium]
MKRIGLTVLAVLLTLATGFAKPKPSGFGTLDKTLVFTPTGGLVFPMGDFGDGADMGFMVGGNIEYFVHPQVALSGNLAYHSFGAPTGVPDGADFFLIGGGVRGLLFDDAKINPYGRAAAGLYQGDDESNVGLNFGGGVLIRSSKTLGFFAEGALHFVFGQGSGASTTVNFFGVTGGLVVTIPTGN